MSDRVIIAIVIVSGVVATQIVSAVSNNRNNRIRAQVLTTLSENEDDTDPKTVIPDSK